MTRFAIEVRGLWKEYTVGVSRQRHSTFYELLEHAIKAPFKRRHNLHDKDVSIANFWALQDVEFEVSAGEILGVVGRNGAGKSTLLKILSRITPPTRGSIRVHGRLASLLEVGTGFHPELTGRENIFLNGAILGMKRHEVVRKFDEIVSFAEVEKFVDTPVKRYSSGMYVRMAFAVAAHLEADILLVDEVLAVGDLGFQKKCLGKIGDVASSGRTVLLVSHNTAAIEGLCTRALYFEQGRLSGDGGASEVVQQYIASMKSLTSTKIVDRTDRTGSGAVKLVKVAVQSGVGNSPFVRNGERVDFAFYYELSAPVKELCVHGVVTSIAGDPLVFLGTDLVGKNITNPPAKGCVLCSLEGFPLSAGQYSMDVYLVGNGYIADKVVNAIGFSVVDSDYYGSGRMPPAGYSKVHLKQTWHST